MIINPVGTASADWNLLKKPLRLWGIESIKNLKVGTNQQIYLATNTFNMSFVVRVVSFTPEREALWRSLSQYQLPHLGQIIGYQKWESCLLILEKHYSGRVLTDCIHNVGCFECNDIILAGVQMVKDLSVLYQREEILHLDIKPDNIMIDAFGNATLLDFGASLSGILKLDLMKIDQYGTPSYTAPERLMAPNKMGALTDLHSLSKTLKVWLSSQNHSHYELWQELTKWEEKGMQMLRESALKSDKAESDAHHYEAYINDLLGQIST